MKEQLYYVWEGRGYRVELIDEFATCYKCAKHDNPSLCFADVERDSEFIQHYYHDFACRSCAPERYFVWFSSETCARCSQGEKCYGACLFGDNVWRGLCRWCFDQLKKVGRRAIPFTSLPGMEAADVTEIAKSVAVTPEKMVQWAKETAGTVTVEHSTKVHVIKEPDYSSWWSEDYD